MQDRAELVATRARGWALAWVVLLALLPAAPGRLAAQSLTLRLGDSARVQAAPRGKLTVPVHLDLTQAPGTAVAALQGAVTWGPAQLRLDSVRAVAGHPLALTANTTTASGGQATLAWLGSTGATTSGPIARLYFTTGTTAGGTRVAFTPSAASDATGGPLLPLLGVQGHEVCVAGSTWSEVPPRWGDVTSDGLVNVVDAQQLARHLVGLPTTNAGAAGRRGDVTGDGVVNVTDAQQIARYAAGLTAAARINTATGEASEVAAVAQVALSPAVTTAYIGRTRTLVATPQDSAGGSLAGCYRVTWQSLNTVVASVSTAGVVTGRASGSTVVRATSGGRSADATVTVTPVPVASVTVTPATATLVIGATQQLTAVARDSGNVVLTGRSVTWSTSNAAVATVSSTGRVTAKAVGSATVTATVGGVAGTAVVQITTSTAAGQIDRIEVGAPYGAYVVGDTGTFWFRPLASDLSTVVLPQGGFSVSTTGPEIAGGVTQCTSAGCYQRITAQSLPNNQSPRPVTVTVFPSGGPTNGPPVGAFHAVVLSNALDSLVLLGEGFVSGQPYTMPPVTAGSTTVLYPYVFFGGSYTQAMNAEYTVTTGSATVERCRWNAGGLSAQAYCARITPNAAGTVTVHARLRKSDGTYWTANRTFIAQ